MERERQRCLVEMHAWAMGDGAHDQTKGDVSTHFLDLLAGGGGWGVILCLDFVHMCVSLPNFFPLPSCPHYSLCPCPALLLCLVLLFQPISKHHC